MLRRFLAATAMLCALLIPACIRPAAEQPTTTVSPSGRMGALSPGVTNEIFRYMTSVSGAATATGNTIDVKGYPLVCFSITQANTSTPVGSWAVQWSIDASNWFPIFIENDSTSGSITNASRAADGLSFTVSSPAGTVVIGFCVEASGPYMRLVYTRSSGGAATTINAYYFIRAGN